MGDDEEAEKMETTDSEGPRFVVKKVGCLLPDLLRYSSAETRLYATCDDLFFLCAVSAYLPFAAP